MTLQLQVPSMMCSACADAVTKAVTRADPSAAVQIDLTTKQVTIETVILASAIQEAITAIGHEVVLPNGGSC